MTQGFTLLPPHDTPATGPKICVTAAGSWNSTATKESSQCQSIEADLRPQAPHLLELATLHCASTALASTCETWDVNAMSQGV